MSKPKKPVLCVVCGQIEAHLNHLNDPEMPTHQFVKPRGRWARFLDGLGEAIGEAMFGGGR